jgi:phosphate transport system substrate-binding protein
MYPVFSSIEGEPGGLGYTVYYYKENMVRDGFGVKTLAVNEIFPSKETIHDRTYPFTAEVYMIVRADIDRSSMAYKVCEYMQAEGGRKIVEESGYIPMS